MPMVLLNGTRLTWLQKDSNKGMDLIMKIRSVLCETTTIRLLVLLAVTRGWSRCQLDVQNAFFHGVLEEEGYMLPAGFVEQSYSQDPGHLEKALYGLKKALRAWHACLVFVFRTGFVPSTADKSLFLL
jgi:hypothetical protein